jgi:hypothetical protein
MNKVLIYFMVFLMTLMTILNLMFFLKARDIFQELIKTSRTNVILINPDDSVKGGVIAIPDCSEYEKLKGKK